MLHDSCIINGHVPLDLSGNFEVFFLGEGGTIFLNYLMPENNHRNDWILDLFGGPNEAGKYEMKVSLFRPESQKLTESWFVFIPFRYRSNDVSKKSRGLVGRGLGWQQVGYIPPISNFIPLPSHQEVYCNSAHFWLLSRRNRKCIGSKSPWDIWDARDTIYTDTVQNKLVFFTSRM